MAKLILVVCNILLQISLSQAQDKYGLEGQLPPEKLLQKINNRVSLINKRLDKQTAKYIQQIERNEKKLLKRVATYDSVAVADLFKDTLSYQKLIADFHSNKPLYPSKGQEYLSVLDSIQTSVKFFEKYGAGNTQLQSVKKQYNLLNDKLKSSDCIKEYITDRKKQLSEALGKYPRLPKSIMGTYQKLNKEAFYYSSQLRQFKSLSQNPSKLEKELLGLASKIPAFSDFMNKHSFLSSLFPSSAGSLNASETILQNLQTRALIQEQVQQQFGSGAGMSQSLNQSMQAAQNELRKLKNKINAAGGSNSSADIPDFKPNSQKTKSFLKRLEYGATINSQKSNRLLPVSSELGVTVAFKLNDKFAFGLRSAYKIGWGQNILKMSISHEGVNLGSFLETKIKGSFFLTGGYEHNYNAAFKRFEELKNAKAWTQGGLLGLSKKYRINNKFKGNLQLLWDFLSYSQAPRTPAFIYRLGYNF